MQRDDVERLVDSELSVKPMRRSRAELAAEAEALDERMTRERARSGNFSEESLKAYEANQRAWQELLNEEMQERFERGSIFDI